MQKLVAFSQQGLAGEIGTARFEAEQQPEGAPTCSDRLGQQVAVLVAEISAASSEQATGIAQVNEAVAQLDTLTQQNAAMVEQLSASAASLSSQAEGVAEAVRIFGS